LPSVPWSSYTKECFSELLGTYILVLIGPASVIITAALPPVTKMEALALIATTFGGVVSLLILAIGKYSGAVINPAITIAATLSGNLKGSLLLPYLFFQCMGGLGAGFTLWILFSSFDSTNLGSTKLAPGIDPMTGILIEAIGTFVLASSALVEGSIFKKEGSRAALVGATLFFLIILIGPITGASFNPARSLGPAVFSNYFVNLYVYLIGPITGALFAGILLRLVKERNGRKKNPVRMRT